MKTVTVEVPEGHMIKIVKEESMQPTQKVMGKSKSKSGGARNYTPLLTARPKGMSYQEYRERRAYQNAWLKERLKGFICYVSSELFVYDKITGLPRLFNHRTDDIHKANIRTNPQPFVGSARYGLKPL